MNEIVTTMALPVAPLPGVTVRSPPQSVPTTVQEPAVPPPPAPHVTVGVPPLHVKCCAEMVPGVRMVADAERYIYVSRLPPKNNAVSGVLQGINCTPPPEFIEL